MRTGCLESPTHATWNLLEHMQQEHAGSSEELLHFSEHLKDDGGSLFCTVSSKLINWVSSSWSLLPVMIEVANECSDDDLLVGDVLDCLLCVLVDLVDEDGPDEAFLAFAASHLTFSQSLQSRRSL